MKVASVDKEGLIDPGPSERGSHGFATEMLCLRKAAAIRAGVISINADALLTGSLFHLGVAHELTRIAGQRVMTGEDAISRKCEILSKNGTDPATLRDAARRATEWTQRYVPAWRREYPGHVVVEVEREYRARYKSHGRVRHFTARNDLVMRSPQGLHYIVDHKSAFEISTQTLDQYVADLQMISYRWQGKRRWGDKFGGVVIGRVNKRYSGRRNEKSTSFDLLPPADQAVEDLLETLAFWDGLRDRFENVHWSKNPASFTQHTCRDRYRPCDLVSYCTQGVLFRRENAKG